MIGRLRWGGGAPPRVRDVGAHCGNCVRHVQDALAEIPGVSALVDLDTAVATVTHPATVPVQALLDVVAEAGYEVAVRGPELG